MDLREPPEPWLARLRGPAAVVALGLLAYANSFHAELTFDDDWSIRNNPLLRSLANYLPGGAGYQAQPTRYLANLSFALNYALGGLDVTGYHAVNLAIHLANALLVHALVRLCFRTPRLARSVLAPQSRAIALVAALLFVAHPLQTQAVTYVVQRLTSLATTFYLLAVVLYARWRLARTGGTARPLGSAAGQAAVVASALLAMRTKEIAATLPVAVALFEWSFFESRWRERLRCLAPVLATLPIVPASVLVSHASLGDVLSDVAQATRVQTAISRHDYLVTQLAVIARYLRLLVLPTGQNLDYDFPIYRSLEPAPALGLLLVLCLGAVAAWPHLAGRARPALDPGARLVSFGIAWFLLALAVESSVIPIADVIFEHRVYLPSVGFFVAAATGLAALARRLVPLRAGAATAAAGAAISLALGAATFARNQVWATDVSIWTDAVAKSPGKSRPRGNLGLALARLHRETEAIPVLREAVRLDPGNFRALTNLGVCLSRAGSADEAREALLAAIRVKPDYAEPQYDLGRLLLQQGRFAEAAPYFRRAIELQADYADAYANLAATWNAMGRYGDTVALLEGARAVIRQAPVAHYNLGLAYGLLGNEPGARAEMAILDVLSPGLALQLRQDLAGSGERR